MTTFASMFTGGGLADQGARMAGLTPVWGVEFDPAIAAVAQQNDDSGTVYAADVRSVDYAALPRVDVLHASPPCFPAGTTVLAKRGLIPIEQIVIGDEVLTHMGRYRVVTHVMRREANTIMLHGQGHWGLEATPNHPFLSSARQNVYPPYKERKPGNYVQKTITPPEWVAAESMQGRHWLSHSTYPELPIPSMEYRGNEPFRGQTFEWTPEFFWFVGAWVGDGWTRYREATDTTPPRGEVLLCTGKHESDYVRSKLTAANVRFIESDERTTTRFTIMSRPLARWLLANFGQYAHGKTLPAWLLGAPVELRRAFFDGYTFADGCTTHPKSYEYPVISASTVSQHLAVGMRMLALSLGYSCILKRYARQRQSTIENRGINERPTYTLRFTTTDHHSFTIETYRSGCVRTIALASEAATVYDITVADDESFVADGIIVHNCPNFSIAKTDRGETALDLELADAVVRAITAQRPALFTLENVRGYAASESLTRIQAALLDLDYHVTTVVVNAADYGVPQTRERLFLLAHAGGWMQAERPLPAPQPWRGWYQAIEDLIPTLPDSQFAPWQLARLPEMVGETMLFGNSLRHDFSDSPKWRKADEPCETLTTMYRPSHMPRAFIVEGQPGLNGTYLNVRDSSDPVWTVAASADRKPARAWLSTGRVVSMTPRALGRFQSLPDTYRLPEKKPLACKIIGNGVACEAYAALLRSQL